jgi:hypothetical protein
MPGTLKSIRDALERVGLVELAPEVRFTPLAGAVAVGRAAAGSVAVPDSLGRISAGA